RWGRHRRRRRHEQPGRSGRVDPRRRHASLSVLRASALGLGLGLLALAGCEGSSATPRRASAPPARTPAGAHVEELSPEALAAEPTPPAIADPPGPGEMGGAAAAMPRTIERAPAPDSDHTSDEPV